MKGEKGRRGSVYDGDQQLSTEPRREEGGQQRRDNLETRVKDEGL